MSQPPREGRGCVHSGVGCIARIPACIPYYNPTPSPRGPSPGDLGAKVAVAETGDPLPAWLTGREGPLEGGAGGGAICS